MPWAAVDNVYLVGVNQDVDPVELPPNVWTSALNTRMTQQGIRTVRKFSNQMAPISIEDATGIFFFRKNDLDYWLTANATKVARDSGLAYALFLNTFAADATLGWNGDNHHQIQLLNNGVDVPVFWTGDTAVTTLPDITAWPTGQVGDTLTLIDARAKVVRSFLNFIIALNITDKTPTPDDRLDQMVMWSDSSTPGAMPASWDYSDKENLAGRQFLTNTKGAIIDGLPLGNLFMIYKDDSLWGMNFTGAPLVFDFFKLSNEINALASNCIAPFPRGHAVLSNGNFLVHSGDGNYQAPLTRRYRESLFNSIDQTNLERVFVVRQPLHDEIWICYPELGEAKCTRALIWNWTTNAIWERDLDDVRAGVFGIQTPPQAAELWSSESALNWDDDLFPWDVFFEEVSRDSLVLTGKAAESTGTANTSYLRLMDVFDSEVKTDDFTLERLDISLAGQKSDGTPVVDRKIRKVWVELHPRMEVEGSGVTITIRVGGRNNPNDVVTWNSTQTFDPSTDDILYFLVNYRLLAISITGTFTLAQDARVTIYAYDMKISSAGRR